ncbi:MAG: glutamate-1-semialdehyde 2,1-aminomutase [Chloroflexi bacterium]|nr:glutamate-1-semialdehyde 2,1-aminomutase [Chloroflexota bacterium]
MKRDLSRKLFAEAQRYIPGGVSSPVRAFGAVGGEPLVIRRGAGARIFDVDGNELIDYVCSWGPLILGHAHPKVARAIQEALRDGTTFGAPCLQETTLAKLICEALPSVELVRFVSSGTEAAMSALRLARGYTGRDLIVKFAGCYHGHSDGLLAEAGSGVATLGIPGSPGVPASYAQNTIVAPYNDLGALERIFQAQGGDIAAVIVEPVAGNMGVVLPRPGFLPGLRRLTAEHGALLIFDEVITGFRLGWGGAQGHYQIKPDLTCLGKIIGGGLPVGAYGGRRDIMERVAPQGPVYQAGTLSGNPLAMAAGIATLEALKSPSAYEKLEALGRTLEAGLAAACRQAKIPARIVRAGSVLTLFFTPGEVTDYNSALRCDTARYGAFFRAMLEAGVYLPPSQFEAWFLSLAHTEQDVEATIAAAARALSVL